LPGIFFNTNELILPHESTLTPLGYNTVGLIMLIDVGAPNSYLVIFDRVGINTLTVVPLASTSSRLANEDRSIVPVRFVQSYIENVTRS
jgi:hypothetical protein